MKDILPYPYYSDNWYEKYHVIFSRKDFKSWKDVHNLYQIQKQNSVSNIEGHLNRFDTLVLHFPTEISGKNPLICNCLKRILVFTKNEGKWKEVNEMVVEKMSKLINTNKCIKC